MRAKTRVRILSMAPLCWIGLAGCGLADTDDSAAPAALDILQASSDALTARVVVHGEQLSIDANTTTVPGTDDNGAPVSQRQLHLTVQGQDGTVYAENFIDLDADGTREDVQGMMGGQSFGGAEDDATDSDAQYWELVKTGHGGEVIDAVSASADEAVRSHAHPEAAEILSATSQLAALLAQLGTSHTDSVAAAPTDVLALSKPYKGVCSVRWYQTLFTQGWNGKMHDTVESSRKVGVKIFEWDLNNGKKIDKYVSTAHYGRGTATVGTQNHGDWGKSKCWWPGTPYYLWSPTIQRNL